MVARYDKWRQESVEKLDADEAYFHELLRPWVAEQLADTKKKSINLPSGRVGFRAGSKSFMLNGEKVDSTNQDLVDIVESDDSVYVETKKSVRWGEYKKTLHVLDDGRVTTSQGEIIPDMKVEQEEPKFYVEVSKND